MGAVSSGELMMDVVEMVLVDGSVLDREQVTVSYEQPPAWEISDIVAAGGGH